MAAGVRRRKSSGLTADCSRRLSASASFLPMHWACGEATNPMSVNPSRLSCPRPTGLGKVTAWRADAARLLARAEAEKTQVARAIHDDLGQQLTALNLELSVWKSELDSDQSKSLPAIRKKIAVLSQLTDGLIGFTRQVTGHLRPRVLEEFGLAAALEWHLKKVQKQTGLACRFSGGRGKIGLDKFVAAQLFRISEEVIARRAQAGGKSLLVRLLTQGDAVVLVFEDSGQKRRVSSEVSARVRLLGGEIAVNNGKKSIVVTLPGRG